MARAHEIRLGADIGGTFTDIALDLRGEILSTKVFTDQSEPERAILEGISIVLEQAGIGFNELEMIIHGTTLATNALIERRGAKTALITTEGFRDVIEMRTENRFDQYDLNLQLPSPLIPRQHRYTVKGRIDALGRELQPLDESEIYALVDVIRDTEFESIAIGFIHSYRNPAHEQRTREILASYLPDLPISISSEVSPQFREYQRFSTVCANAYVRPRVQRYLARLHDCLLNRGTDCSVFLIHSAGGLMSVDTAKEFPVRLLESGPAGGAIFASNISERFRLGRVVSFDMGGTTAKICLIENYEPQTTRTFEVARSHRFCKGSGIPISIPVIEMIEIGAGGGSISWVDAMQRIQIGPESAGSEPGPACYQRGGERATVTDADVMLGKIDPKNFAGGAILLSKDASLVAINRDVGKILSLEPLEAAYGICEVVDENMANAARVHAVERGKNISEFVMIAFGGAAPLHASRLCDKLRIDQCLIPPGAGVGSAIGFLKAPFSYEAVASRVVRLSEFDVDAVNDILSNLVEEAESFVRVGTSGAIHREIVSFMRYQGQGWEIPVPMPDRTLTIDDVKLIQNCFRKCYANYFGRTIDELEDLEIEVVSWSVRATDERKSTEGMELIAGHERKLNDNVRMVFDSSTNEMMESRIVAREALTVGDRIAGPIVIVERETSTVVTSCFDAVVQNDGSILLTRKKGDLW